jgi:RNA polymerase sigma-70 factor (ECF subfamily)
MMPNRVITEQTSEQALMDDWVRRAQAGDADAFANLFDHYYDQIYRFAVRVCGNATDAEDIAQQSAIKLAHSISQFKFESKFTTWLYRLVTNTAIDWLRADHKHQSTPDFEPEVGSNDGFNWVLLHQLLAQVDALGAGFLETIALVVGEGMSHAEAAEILQVKESTISWRIHKVRKWLNSVDGGDHD